MAFLTTRSLEARAEIPENIQVTVRIKVITLKRDFFMMTTPKRVEALKRTNVTDFIDGHIRWGDNSLR